MTPMTQDQEITVSFATKSGVGLMVNLQAIPGATVITLGRFSLDSRTKVNPVPALEVNGSVPKRSDFVYLTGHS